MELVFPDSFNVVQPVPCTSLVHEVGSQFQNQTIVEEQKPEFNGQKQIWRKLYQKQPALASQPDNPSLLVVVMLSS